MQRGGDLPGCQSWVAVGGHQCGGHPNPAPPETAGGPHHQWAAHPELPRPHGPRDFPHDPHDTRVHPHAQDGGGRPEEREEERN